MKQVVGGSQMAVDGRIGGGCGGETCDGLDLRWWDDKELLVRLAEIRRGRLEASRLVNELSQRSREEQLAWVRQCDRRLLGRSVVEELLARCRPAAPSDEGLSLHLATLAWEVALRIDGDAEGLTGGPCATADLRGRAAAWRGHALRCLGRSREAMKSFELAAALLECGSGDVELHAELQSFRALLLADRGDHAAALQCLEEARKVYRALGAGDRELEIESQRARILGACGSMASTRESGVSASGF